jgi:predicted nucleic acid-binding protein
MNGREFVFDTNIFLYLQSGRKDLIQLFNESSVFVSVITEMELLSYSELNENSEKELTEALKSCFVVDIELPIRKIAIDLRKKYKLKLPDALICATAIHLQLPLISADQDLQKVDELMLYLYKTI